MDTSWTDLTPLPQSISSITILLFRLSPWCRNVLRTRTYEICLWNCSSALESVPTEIKRYKSGSGICEKGMVWTLSLWLFKKLNAFMDGWLMYVREIPLICLVFWVSCNVRDTKDIFSTVKPWLRCFSQTYTKEYFTLHF